MMGKHLFFNKVSKRKRGYIILNDDLEEQVFENHMKYFKWTDIKSLSRTFRLFLESMVLNIEFIECKNAVLVIPDIYNAHVKNNRTKDRFETSDMID